MKDNKINKARALYYAMFSRFFVFTTDNSRYLELINLIETLKQNPLDETTAVAFEEIQKSVTASSNIAFMKEFDVIFHSPESSTVKTTASFYDEDIESGKKRVEMQNFLAKTKIRRNEKLYSDYEDHIGFIFAVLSELSTLVAEGEEQYANTAHCVFSQILNDFVDEFSKDLYEHEDAKIFKNVVVILKAFMEFERIYLEVSIPAVKERVVRQGPTAEITDEERQRRERNRALRVKGPKKEQKEVFVTYDVEEDM